MLKSSAPSAIRLRGVRHNNLKNFDLDLPLNQLIVITGLSGSGKSSLAFDTLFAEGQRRYIETFSPYARQFLDRMDKPQVDSIEGIPPAIAIEQRNSVKTTRSTVGTMTELCDYMKMLWPHVSQLHCRNCGEPVRKEPAQHVFERCAKESRELLLTFTVPLTEKLSLQECLALVAKQGYQRVLVSGRILRLEELAAQTGAKARAGGRDHPTFLTVVQDRVRPTPANRARFVEACEQAYHFGKGKLAIWTVSDASVIENPRFFSAGLHCAQCDIEYREPSPALFSFNNPVGACPTCRGFGRVISIDYDLALPDWSRTLAQGVVKPWLTGHGLESQTDLLRACRELDIPVNVPFEKLSKKWQEFVINGDPDYGTDEEHQWPRAWYGVKGYFRWLESKAYKMHVRVLLSRYRAYTPCPDCLGKRFQPEALLYRLSQAAQKDKSSERAGAGLTLADFYELPVRDALRLVTSLKVTANSALKLVLGEVRSRLAYLDEVGLGYLTLGRPTRSLSGGETERVNLTTCLGTRLVNTLFVLDEPSVGLHPRDTQRLIGILKQLRDAGNTVVVVEHEASVMRAADQIVDLGPGHGATGGQVVFQGPYPEALNCKESLTGQYLSGEKQIEVPKRRAVRKPPGEGRLRGATQSSPLLGLSHASRHNLRDLSVKIPLQRLVCVTGVSGSGKTTLVGELLLPALAARLKADASLSKASERMDSEANGDDLEDAGNATAMSLSGAEHLNRVVLVDQSILGKTPRSNPAVYIGAFDELREFFAQSENARQRSLNASAFSFNSSQGQCERCRGAGFEKIEMQFLSDVFIRCPDCDGRRYRSHILEVKISPTAGESSAGSTRAKARSIADLLDSTVEEVIAFLGVFPESRPARRALTSLKLLEEVGLGYLKIGQPINTLSGGESQRLKLVRHLAEALQPVPRRESYPETSKSEQVLVLREAMNKTIARFRNGASSGEVDSFRPEGQLGNGSDTLFLFDEPTTGLHFDDVRVLLKVFQRLVDAGHSVVVIEHNLEVLKSADWLIDLGPGAGDEGGRLVAEGTPEEVAACAGSYTGQALREVLPSQTTVRSRSNAALPTPKAQPSSRCPGI